MNEGKRRVEYGVPWHWHGDEGFACCLCLCRAAIEKLRAQNEQLKHDLLLENKFSVRPGDAYAQALINSLQDEGDNLARKVTSASKATVQPSACLQGLHGSMAQQPGTSPATGTHEACRMRSAWHHTCACAPWDADCAGDAQDQDAGPAARRG